MTCYGSVTVILKVTQYFLSVVFKVTLMSNYTYNLYNPVGFFVILFRKALFELNTEDNAK